MMMSNDFIFHVSADAEPAAAPNLGEMLRNSGWSQVLGDWVDQGTLGEFRVSLKWKIENQLLEMTTIDQNGANIGLIRVDPKTHEITMSATNYVGAVTSGRWDFTAEEGPKMTGRFETVEGASGDFALQFVPTGDNTMVLRVGAQTISNVPLVRKQFARRVASAF